MPRACYRYVRMRARGWTSRSPQRAFGCRQCNNWRCRKTQMRPPVSVAPSASPSVRILQLEKP